VTHPRERKQFLQNIDIRLVLLSVLAGILLFIILIIILWKVSLIMKVAKKLNVLKFSIQQLMVKFGD
jgi:hypothetical protein